MLKLKNPRSCKNCQFSEGGSCLLKYPVVRSSEFPYIPFPTKSCYKVISVKDYMTIIKFKEVYEYKEDFDGEV